MNLTAKREEAREERIQYRLEDAEEALSGILKAYCSLATDRNYFWNVSELLEQAMDALKFGMDECRSELTDMRKNYGEAG